MPPEIREIVDEAGESNCFYYSDRWRQSTKPSDGDAADEMPNTVPGSEIEATQGAASAKPIAANEGFSFEGDDVYPMVGGPDIDPDRLIVVMALYPDPIVLDESVQNNSSRVAAYGGTSSSGSSLRLLQLQAYDGGNLGTYFRIDDGTGTSYVASVNINPAPGDETVVLCGAYDLSSGDLHCIYRSESERLSAHESISAGSLLGQDPAIGDYDPSGGGLPYKGVIVESLICAKVNVSAPRLDRLVDAMWWRHQ
jgi:hypothetical protein